MRLNTALLGLSAAFLTGVSAQGCKPDLEGREVTMGVTGKWNARPVAAGSTINPTSDGAAITFAVIEDDEGNVTFTTKNGELAVSGTTGALKLAATNADDSAQKYTILGCSQCYESGEAVAAACDVRVATIENQCIWPGGAGRPAEARVCGGGTHGPPAYIHFFRV